MSSQPPSNLPIPDPTLLTTELVDRGKAEIRELFEARIAGILKEEETWRDRQIEVGRLNQIAIDKAVDTLNLRLAGMNEFRAALRDQQADFLTRREFEAKYDAQGDKIDGIQTSIDQSKGRDAVVSAVIAIGASAVVSLIVGIIIVVISRIG